MNIELIKGCSRASIYFDGLAYREIVRKDFANSTEFALEVMECAKKSPMGDYWDAKDECYKQIKMDWQERIILFTLKGD